jgi:yecA family protein
MRSSIRLALCPRNAPDDGMGLSDLDGFLTGIAAGRELILPSEWLPVIRRSEEPEFETEEDCGCDDGPLQRDCCLLRQRPR